MDASTYYGSSATMLDAGVYATAYAISLVIGVICIIGLWKIFVKAGKPGWASIVPFYNYYCLFDITFGNGWMFFLLFVPCVNIVFEIILCFKLAKAFGKGVGFGFGLLFLPPIFLLILGFDSSNYIGPQ